MEELIEKILGMMKDAGEAGMVEVGDLRGTVTLFDSKVDLGDESNPHRDIWFFVVENKRTGEKSHWKESVVCG